MLSLISNIFQCLYYRFHGDYEIRIIERINSNETFIMYFTDEEND